VVSNTFIDIVCEDRFTLTRVASAPGKVESSKSPDTVSGDHLIDDSTRAYGATTSWQEVAATLVNEKVSDKEESDDFLCCENPQEHHASECEAANRLQERSGDEILSSDDAAAFQRRKSEADLLKLAPATAKILSQTAKRNQRRRALASAAKSAGTEACSPVHDSATTNAALDASSTSDVKAAKTGIINGTNAAATENVVAGKAGATKAESASPRRKTFAASSSPPGSPTRPESSTTSSPKTERQSQSASGSSHLDNPTVAQRMVLKMQFMEFFCQDAKIENTFSGNTSSTPMTPEELAKFAGDSERLLVSLHGDVFDVSSNRAEYGPDGVHSFEAGTDITWVVVSGAHTKENCNCFYDIFKAQDQNELASRLLPLCRTNIAFQRDYGTPVARLTVFSQERSLQPPPVPPVDCVVQ
jgi:predicted heme/steroid binding protein